MKEIDFGALRKICIDAIIRRQPVQLLCDNFYRCIKLPILCLDLALQSFAFAFQRPFYFPAWENAALRNLQDSEIIDRGYLKHQEMMYQSRCASIFETGTNAPAPAAACPIFHNGKLVGYCGIMLEDADRRMVVEANDMLSKTISALLSNDVSSELYGITGEEAAEQILLKNNLLASTSVQFETRCPGGYVYIVFHSGTEAMATLQYCRKTLCTAENSILGCLDGDSYLCMLCYRVKPEELGKVLAQANYVTTKYDLTCGVSDYFTSPDQISAHHMQAMLTLSAMEETGGESRVLSFASRYTEVVGYGAAQWYGRACCRQADAEELILFDSRNGGKYVETLLAYSRSFNSSSETAKCLGLHKNTVLSRLAKIEDVVGYRLSDPRRVESLCAGIWSHLYMDKLPEVKR